MVLRVLIIFALSLLLGSQAYNLSRGGGDTFFAFMIAMGVVIGLFVGEAILTAAMTQRENTLKSFCMAATLIVGCMVGEYLVYVAGHVSMSIGGYKQLESELEDTYEMRTLREEKNNAAWDGYYCSQNQASGCDRAAINARKDQIRSEMNSLRDDTTETPTQAALAATGHNVSSVAANYAALVQLVSIILAGAVGMVWGVDIPDEKPKRQKPVENVKAMSVAAKKREPFVERQTVELVDYMNLRHPTKNRKPDNTPGNVRDADYAHQFQHAKQNIAKITDIESIKRECSCGQARAAAIRDQLIAEGVWKGRTPKRLETVKNSFPK